jgi:GNAT superfamily N-acetyltransferase
VVVGTMLAGAFLDDPVMHWMQPLRSRRAHPTTPHWYLNKLGAASAARGQGLASALLSAQLCHCDNTATPAYLEATQHTLIGFYETFGFTCTDPIDVPHGGPRVWGMWRAPR